MTTEKMQQKRQTQVWDLATYTATVAELRKCEKTKRLSKKKRAISWKLDTFGRIIRKKEPHQILLPLEPIPAEDEGDFLPSLEMGAADRIRKTHTDMLHAGAYKVHKHLTQDQNYCVPRRLVEETLVNQCDICLKQVVRRVATPAVPVRAFWPMQRVELDFIDCRNKHVMLPREMQHGNWDNGTKSKTEYKIDYILIIVCQFSGYAWCRPVYNNSQWEVCFEITRWANEFGWPQICHTDNGTPFDSRMLTELCRSHDTFLVHGRPYHPQSQGKAERLIRTLKNMAIKMQQDDALLPRQPWLQYLARACFVYNRIPHAKTGVAPFVAFYGRKPMEGLAFTGEWEMNALERRSRDIVFARKKYRAASVDDTEDHEALLEYFTQLTTPSDEQDKVDRDALLTYLIDQQPKFIAQIRALQDHRNSAMVRRSIRAQGELKAVHVGDRVVFSKVSGVALGMAAKPFDHLQMGTVTAEHLGGGIMQTYTIEKDNKEVHVRVPRENIGIRIPGNRITDVMKDCAKMNIVAQAQTFALRVGKALGIEAPETCIDPRPGFKTTTFAQVPFRDPLPTAAIAEEAEKELAEHERQMVLARPVVTTAGSARYLEDRSDHPQTVVQMTITRHQFKGGSCPGCACNDCDITLGGKKGKYCTDCYKEAGLTFCRKCHDKRQPV